jgi:dTDP-4-dehydrorhamnose 3,5-epimerase
MGLYWNDPALGIEWPISDPIVSEKDKVQPSLQDFKSPF